MQRLGRQVVQAPASGEEEAFDFDHFNAEKETFPYEDDSFDLVLCCEILEHLPEDPVNLLAESHRVLRKPSGRLLLTTPNAARTDNVIRLIRGRNVYEQISGYGVYGRHNREYTLEELGDLLTQCGYEVTSLFAADTQPGSERLARLTRLTPGTRQDRLFALARPLGEPRWRYPDWLFASKHALRRVARPDLVMGVNDDLQSFGFRELVKLHGRCGRWIGEDSATTVVSLVLAGREGGALRRRRCAPRAGRRIPPAHSGNRGEHRELDHSLQRRAVHPNGKGRRGQASRSSSRRRAYLEAGSGRGQRRLARVWGRDRARRDQRWSGGTLTGQGRSMPAEQLLEGRAASRVHRRCQGVRQARTPCSWS